MDKKIKKADIVKALTNTITDEQWKYISLLRGLPTPAKKENFISGLFKKTITIASRKGKARNLQKWFAQKIGEFLNEPYGKDMSICSREMGQAGADIRMSPRICKRFPFTAECKSGNSWSIHSALKQCQANLYPDTEWILVLDRPSSIKEDRISPIVCIDGEVFFKILRREIDPK